MTDSPDRGPHIDPDPQAGGKAAIRTDAERRRGLRRMRSLALSLLIAAAACYALTYGQPGGWGYLNAAAEASMVGAIADWFAVTALFRRPLGLPIPHTALIPSRKQALGRSLQEFVASNFLTESVVRARVARAKVSERLGSWLRVEANARRVVNEAAELLRGALLRISDDDVASLVGDELLPRLADEPVADVAGALLAQIVEDGSHHGLVDLAASETLGWLVANPDRVAQILQARAPWWTPRWLDEQIVSRVQREVQDWVTEIRDDPDHPVRKAIDDALGSLADDLLHDANTREQVEALKRRLLTRPQVRAASVSLWQSLRRALLAAIDDPASALRERAVAALRRTGEQLVTDDALRARVDGLAEDAVAFLVGRYGAELTAVITDTIDRWDGEEASRRIELHIGRDLQFVRINGTLVGGLAGLAIHALSQLL